MKKVLLVAALLYHCAAFACFDTDHTVPVEELLPKAEQGDIDSQVALAKEYYEGKHFCGGGEYVGPPQDFSKALYWFKNAADRGNAEAQYMLGVMYVNGHGVDSDPKAAHAWFLKAAANGHRAAMAFILQGFY